MFSPQLFEAVHHFAAIKADNLHERGLSQGQQGRARSDEGDDETDHPLTLLQA